RVAPPDAVFFMVGAEFRELLPSWLDPKEFSRVRRSAESEFYQTKNRDGTLEEIYGMLGQISGIGDPLLKRLRERELSFERETLYLIPNGFKSLLACRKEGVRILYLSDMYLPVEVLRGILEEKGVWKDGDRLYVSADLGKNKRTGELFRHVLGELQIRAGQLKHKGNCRKADFDMPRRMGVASEYIGAGNLSYRESLVAGHCNATNGFAGVLAGISRRVRLTWNNDFQSPRHRTLMELGASVVAPAMTGFCQWILQEARTRGIDRLYFVARDGFFPSKLADILVRKHGWPIRVSYLYGSRQAWYLASLDLTNLDASDWLFIKSGGLTAKGIIERLQLDPDEWLGRDCSGADPVKDHPLKMSFQEARVFLEELLKNEDFLLAANDSIERARSLTLAYLREQGLLNGDRFALVDIGWVGRSQVSLDTILKSDGSEGVPMGLYFGLNHERILSRRDGQERRAFLIGDHCGRGTGLDTFSHHFLESLFSAPHGTTEGYRMDADGSHPVLGEYSKKEMDDWGMPILEEVVERYTAELLLAHRIPTVTHKALSDLVYEILEDLDHRPEAEEALALGGFVCERDSVSLQQQHCLASPIEMNVTTLARAFTFANALPIADRTMWPGGCRALTPKHRLFIFEMVRRAGCIARGLRRRFGKTLRAFRSAS
ncbi:MAG: hypothetical protein P1U90_07560, partial [Akkermansiaceae bacterium]|nr:hypothetical protein [Akkermansiaceae bacterium]